MNWRQRPLQEVGFSPLSPIPSSACWERRGAIWTLTPQPRLPGSSPEPVSSAGSRPRPVCQLPGIPGCRKCPASWPSAAQPWPPEQPDSFHPFHLAMQIGLSDCHMFSFLCTFAQGEALFTLSALSLRPARLSSIPPAADRHLLWEVFCHAHLHHTPTSQFLPFPLSEPDTPLPVPPWGM